MRLQLIIIIATLIAPLTLHADVLRISQLSDRPKKDFTELRPMARFAAHSLGHIGLDSFEVKLFREFSTLCHAVKTGAIDWVTETPYIAAKLVSECGAIPIAVKWKKQQQKYASFIYTRKDSNVKSLIDLKGKLLALESAASFSAYYLPLLSLKNRNIEFIRVDHPSTVIPKGKVGYFFSRNEKNNIKLVLKSIAKAGSLNNGDWTDEKIVNPKEKQSLRIIHRSPSYPRSFELVSPTFADKKKGALKNLLLGMNVSEHKAILGRYENSSGFSAIENDDLRILKEISTIAKELN